MDILIIVCLISGLFILLVVFVYLYVLLVIKGSCEEVEEICLIVYFGYYFDVSCKG